jgi:TusA-related sulfurtransferase
MTAKTEYFLDITNEVCPITFVKTKLMLEKMNSGERLELRLSDGEPMENVPRSVEEMGDAIVETRTDKSQNGETIFTLIIQRA